MAKNSVIYHANCYDGFGAAWLCLKALEDVIFFPMSYGDPVPQIEADTNLYIVDFSFPRDVMLLLSRTNTVVCLDHHKTAQANCEGLSFCTFDMNRSGAGLTWDYFYPDTPRPALINYVEDRDLWNWKLPNSHSINTWVASFPRTFKEWDELEASMRDHLDNVIHDGEQIERYYNQKIQEINKEARLTELAGHTIPVVNCPYTFGSDAAHELLQQYPNAPFAAYYLDKADGTRHWGLRSNGFDVSEIAKQFGGGGHQRAAGFIKTGITK